MFKPTPTRYRALNWSSYNASLRERGSLTIWFDPGMAWHAAPSGKRRRQQVFSDTAIPACLTAARQGIAQRCPERDRGALRPAAEADDRLHGEPAEAGWSGLAGAGLLDAVPAARDAGRATALPGFGPAAAPAGPLTGQSFGMPCRAVDGAHDGRACRDSIARRGADAIIPPRRNAERWKKDGPGAGPRNEALLMIKRLGHAIWRRWSGYHRRSRVETKMNGMKRPDQNLMSRDFDRQTAEFQVRIAILNRFTALGTPVTQPVGRRQAAKGDVRPSGDLRNSAHMELFRGSVQT